MTEKVYELTDEASMVEIKIPHLSVTYVMPGMNSVYISFMNGSVRVTLSYEDATFLEYCLQRALKENT